MTTRTMTTELYQPASMINDAVLRLRVWPLIWGGEGGGEGRETRRFISISCLSKRKDQKATSLDQLSKQNLQQRRQISLLAYAGNG